MWSLALSHCIPKEGSAECKGGALQEQAKLCIMLLKLFKALLFYLSAKGFYFYYNTHFSVERLRCAYIFKIIKFLKNLANMLYLFKLNNNLCYIWLIKQNRSHKLSYIFFIPILKLSLLITSIIMEMFLMNRGICSSWRET